LTLYRAFAVDTRATWPIEHVAAGGAELLFILNKALGYATRIRDSVPAKPHRIRRTSICIRLGISDRPAFVALAIRFVVKAIFR
jgi:hypothetical protein